MSSKRWSDSSKDCRVGECPNSRASRRRVVVLGQRFCLASVLTISALIAPPAKAAIGGGGLGQRLQAGQFAPVEKAQATTGHKKYRWYANGWNGPGYYEVGDASKTGVGWVGGSPPTASGSPGAPGSGNSPAKSLSGGANPPASPPGNNPGKTLSGGANPQVVVDNPTSLNRTGSNVTGPNVSGGQNMYRQTRPVSGLSPNFHVFTTPIRIPLR